MVAGTYKTHATAQKSIAHILFAVAGRSALIHFKGIIAHDRTPSVWLTEAPRRQAFIVPHLGRAGNRELLTSRSAAMLPTYVSHKLTSTSDMLTIDT
ncbi:hypothetical protein HYPDE_25833 [Hyphomicrobium denitrificans 1NES1]|uniref:Uncharacterized protein n=1 Tax=Hyphomicrobium denitrificans 1NES1 TaxID=670307 RepID=N0B072_9HYPH|nr:hypothetical protein HYPDE_25833 [Hyphomicrobium denitrificans 1NES1]